MGKFYIPRPTYVLRQELAEKDYQKTEMPDNYVDLAEQRLL